MSRTPYPPGIMPTVNPETPFDSPCYGCIHDCETFSDSCQNCIDLLEYLEGGDYDD